MWGVLEGGRLGEGVGGSRIGGRHGRGKSGGACSVGGLGRRGWQRWGGSGTDTVAWHGEETRGGVGGLG